MIEVRRNVSSGIEGIGPLVCAKFKSGNEIGEICIEEESRGGVCTVSPGYYVSDTFFDESTGLLVKAYTLYDPILAPLGIILLEGEITLIETNIGD